MSETKFENSIKINFNVCDGTEPYIFVSYSHVNTDAVYKILNRLDKERFRLWYDDTMEIGEDFREELKTRIEGCGAFLLFISKASMGSKYVGMEIITAFKNNKRIFPIYLEADVEIPGIIKMLLENLQHVKGYSTDESNKFINKLVESLPVETMHTLQIDEGVLKKCKDGSEVISLPDDIHTLGTAAFKLCLKLKKIIISNKLEIIGDEAFRGCSGIEKIIIPKNVKSIGESAFRDCINLRELIIENSDIEIGERAFENCIMLSDVTLPEGLSEIYGGVFNSCKSLENIVLPKNLVILGESAFSACIKLKKIIIPECVTKIDDMVFEGCVDLKEVVLPDSLTKLGKFAFKNCYTLSAINIPESVSYIGATFRGCDNLECIVVEAKNRYYKSVDNVLYNKNKSALLCYPAKKDNIEYEVPDSVTLIGDWAFSECKQLKEIIIPDSVCEIGEGAFYKCTNLERIEIPDSVNKIDDTAFRGCTNLKEVLIPNSVREFGWGIFNGCGEVVVICDDQSSAALYCQKKNIKHNMRIVST
jgi:hypothetical protein